MVHNILYQYGDFVKRTIRTKNLAFTLAEMLLILGVFSAIAAAVLPVTSMRKNIDNSETATNAVTIDPWDINTAYNGIGYYNEGSSLGNTSAVMIGGQISDDAEKLGYPQLIVKNNNPDTESSHIVLFKNVGNNPYYGGRIDIKGEIDGSSMNHTIALGANALSRDPDNDEDNVYTKSRAIAIGTNAMYFDVNSKNNCYVRNSIAIGNAAAIPKNDDGYDNSVVIGMRAGLGRNYHESVLIGSNVGSRPISPDEDVVPSRNVLIGENAGYMPETQSDNVSIGYMAGYKAKIGTNTYPHANRSVHLGYYAGSGKRDGNDIVAIGTQALSGQNTRSGSVAIGAFSGVVDSMNSFSDAVFVGYYAGQGSSPEGKTIMLGTYAGSAVKGNLGYVFSLGAGSDAVIIGAYAGSYASNIGGPTLGNIMRWERYDPVIIGYRALSGSKESSAKPWYEGRPAVTIGSYAGYGSYGSLYGSVLMGTYAGAYTSSLKNTICIGYGTCANSDGEYDVRIAPYGIIHYDYLERPGIRAGLSHIGYIGEEIPSNQKGLLIASDETTLLITPKMSPLSNMSSSSIILYAEKVYGPGNMFSIPSDRRLKKNIKPARYGLNDIRKINIYEYTWKDDESKTPKIGVIAQEMQKVIPEGVHKLPNGYLTIDSTWLIYPAVNAIKELDKTVTSLKNDIEAYVKEYSTLVNRILVLEKEVSKLERENKSIAKDIKVAYKKAKTAERR